jgi:hypothetical protein
MNLDTAYEHDSILVSSALYFTKYLYRFYSAQKYTFKYYIFLLKYIKFLFIVGIQQYEHSGSPKRIYRTVQAKNSLTEARKRK